MKKVFLAGTSNLNSWREELINLLTIDYVNPTYSNSININQEDCTHILYVVSKKTTTSYSIDEITNKIVFCFLPSSEEEFSKIEIKSLNAIGKIIEYNGGKVFYDLTSCANFLNNE